MTENNKLATWFWVVSAIALIWNLMGVIAYMAQVMMSPEALQALPENERALLTSTPAWSTGAFAIAVGGGALDGHAHYGVNNRYILDLVLTKSNGQWLDEVTIKFDANPN